MKKNMDYKEKLAVVEAGQACENTHAWHAILHAAGHTTEELDTFWASERDDLYWGYNMVGMYGREEVYEGWAGGLEGGARRLFPTLNELYPETKGMDPLPLSEYSIHTIGTPIIEVGGDLKTARASFYSTGLLFRNISNNGKKMAVWMLERYGDDFVCEDGKWKILHQCVMNDSGGAHDVTNFAIDAYNKMMNPRPGPGGPGPGGEKKPEGPAAGGGPGGSGGEAAPNGKKPEKKAYSKMAGGGPKGSFPASHVSVSPIVVPQDSAPYPDTFETLDNDAVHYVVGLGRNQKKKQPTE